MMHFKVLGKQEQASPKIRGRNKIKIQAGIN
jgi:hypothetical protein